VFAEKIFKVDPNYKVCDVFENGDRVSVKASAGLPSHEVTA